MAKPSPADARLAEALAQHRAGALPAAERGYLAVLRLRPGDVNALHLLGLAQLQQGRARQGAERIAAALKLDTSNNPGLACVGCR